MSEVGPGFKARSYSAHSALFCPQEGLLSAGAHHSLQPLGIHHPASGSRALQP